MKDVEIVTERLILRRFDPRDVEAVYLLFSDKEVNTFLPWYPLDDMKEAEEFYRTRLNGRYCLAICLKKTVSPSATYTRTKATATISVTRSAGNSRKHFQRFLPRFFFFAELSPFSFDFFLSLPYNIYKELH